MIFDIISAVPDLLKSPFEHSILRRAIDRNLIEINIISLRDFGIGPHNQIDDYQYGGGAGLVIMPVPLHNCIQDLKSKNKYDEIIFMTPDGESFKQSTANRLSLLNRVLIILGHYKGIDERIREKHVTLELSIGDYVLSGGELPAAVLVDAVSRLIPGVLNDATSALTDSHQDNLLAPPVYTRPSDFEGMKVPDILLSGDDKKIEDWRYDQSLKKTKKIRPDLLED
ncbi:MAG: tRNA (guanosine(37)-N1)-methyltransferase TrmD [Saprospiraceae bacterium]|nr:tRNA (guanosine(37)-N1)-methyltransferase TrmD [Bacteroidia bacterium]NNE16400.1 tRNA (guanosine(37)-N1)-methyltransferase TrmD [Saprospiraceae bacterium]NNL93496.1 tRNA (guanosine(37)-N1)-methyltransferase TrmD [Saprospiraceae bacterium]